MNVPEKDILLDKVHLSGLSRTLVACKLSEHICQFLGKHVTASAMLAASAGLQFSRLRECTRRSLRTRYEKSSPGPLLTQDSQAGWRHPSHDLPVTRDSVPPYNRPFSHIAKRKPRRTAWCYQEGKVHPLPATNVRTSNFPAHKPVDIQHKMNLRAPEATDTSGDLAKDSIPFFRTAWRRLSMFNPASRQPAPLHARDQQAHLHINPWLPGAVPWS